MKIDKENKDVVKLNMLKKSDNKYVQKYKKYEKELDTFGITVSV